MATSITAYNFECTPAIKAYIEEKTAALSKHEQKILRIDVEVDKNTHHKKGAVFHVRMNVQIPNQLLHAEETQEDLYAAIDLCRDEIAGQLRKAKTKFWDRRRRSQRARRDLKSILTFWRK